MTRNLKVLGLALVAALALSAVAASGASAEQAKFTCAVGATVQCQIHGAQEATDTLTVAGLPAITCTTAKETGFLEENEIHKLGPEAPSLTDTPFYETCHIVLLGITKPVTVTTNGCRHTLDATKNTPTAGSFSADLTVKCESKPIEIHIYNNVAHTETLCTFDINSQTVNNQVTLTNVAGSPSYVLVHFNSTLAVQRTISGGLCGNGENTTAVYKGTHTLSGTDEHNNFVTSSIS